jgi:predicted RNase H-like HicB family nuclease
MNDRYTYRLVWSPKYQKYAAHCCEFPTLASLGTTQLEALNQVVQLVTEIIDAIGAPTHQPLPDPAFENAPSSITRRPLPFVRVVPRWRTGC